MANKDIILKAENISKQYRLGVVGTGTISHDLNRWWYKVRGKADPYLKVGESNDRSTKGGSQYVWALKDINFEVKRGEVLGIIGKNGAGKSTLLKILSKVTGPTTGEIKTRGRIASLLEVGTGFHGEMTGRENVFLNGAILGMTKKEITSKIDEIIEFSGCQRYIDTPVKRYSSGMTVRLAFAVAAFLEPEILVIDEVLAVGDAEFQKKAIGKMQDISRGEGRTVLFVSHNMAAVKALCDRGVVLEKGVFVYSGSIDDAVSFYLRNENEAVLFRNLKDVTRKKKMSAIMKSVEVVDRKEIITSQDVTFRVYFDTKFGSTLSLGYVIKNEMNNYVHAANTQQHNVRIKVKEEKEYIDILMSNLPLNPGKYVLDLYLGNGKFDVDIVEEAISFQVFWKEDENVIPPKVIWGNTFISSKWIY